MCSTSGFISKLVIHFTWKIKLHLLGLGFRKLYLQKKLMQRKKPQCSAIFRCQTVVDPQTHPETLKMHETTSFRWKPTNATASQELHGTGFVFFTTQVEWVRDFQFTLASTCASTKNSNSLTAHFHFGMRNTTNTAKLPEHTCLPLKFLRPENSQWPGFF